jgi:hypothetical protein
MSNIIRFRPNPITDYLTTHWESIRDEYINQKFLEMGIDVRQPNLDNIYSTKHFIIHIIYESMCIKPI